LDLFAAKYLRSNHSLTEGIPTPEEGNDKMSKKSDLTSRTFKNAGAEATEKRRNVEFGRGGKNKDVGEQNADTAQPGRTGHRDGQSGAGRKFGEGGGKVPGNKSSVGISAPAKAGRTGNVEGEAATSSRGPRRDKTRDYGKR
jgi:hypothetical protein